MKGLSCFNKIMRKEIILQQITLQNLFKIKLQKLELIGLTQSLFKPVHMKRIIFHLNFSLHNWIIK